LQVQALRYFLDNQMPSGLVLDRQSNFGPLHRRGLCSTAATGMGAIALALAAADPYRLLPHSIACARIRRILETAGDSLPHVQGVLPHFLDAATGAVVGVDRRSTIDTAWLVAGALWATTFLGDGELRRLAETLYDRIDWLFWTANSGLLRHGQNERGRFLPCCWDRLNGETVFAYVLAAGTDESRAWPARGWGQLRTFPGTVAGFRFGSADLGLFVFQYGYDLLDLCHWREPGGVDLAGEAACAAEANYRFCRGLANRFTTFGHYWGISAGDGPGEGVERDTYRCYSPHGIVDGTAHLMASLASIAQVPARVWENLQHAQYERALVVRGRYGFSNLNLDQQWVGRDVVGIDAGAAILALDNYLMDQRVRRVFHQIPCIQRGLDRLRFSSVSEKDPREAIRKAA
jgi:hypothetical protein